MKRLFKALLLALVTILVVGMPVLAASVAYRATYTIVESAGTPYTMLPVLELADNQWMADNGFFKTTALDTRIETLGGLVKPHMVATNKTLTAVPVPANSQTNLYYTTANSDLNSLDIITGYNGYITITDDDTPAQETLELGSDFEIEQSGYVDTDVGSDKNLVYKEDAFRTYIDGANTITSRIWDWVATFPTVDATSQGSVVVNATNHTVTYPAGLIVGDLLMVFFTTDSNPAITPPAAVGFTTLWDEVGVGAAHRGACYYKVIDGTEGASGVFVTADAQMTAYICFRVSGYSGVPEKSAVVTANNANPNSGNLAPSWGNQWTLWFSEASYDGIGQNTVVVWPVAYADNQINVVPANNEGVDLAVCTQNLAAANSDPAAYTLTGANEWVAHTVGIAPAVYSVTATGIASGEYTVKTYGVANEPQWATGDVLHFTGANDSNVNAGAIHDNIAKLWVSLWFRLDSTFSGASATDQFIWGKFNGAADYVYAYLESDDGILYFNFDDGVNPFSLESTTVTWAADTWYHIITSLSSTPAQRLLVNGTAEDTDTVAASNTPNGGDFCFGDFDDPGAVTGFIGEIQNVIVGIGDLSVAEEDALFTGIAPTGANAPTNYWYTDEGTGTGVDAVIDYGSAPSHGDVDAACSWETATYTYTTAKSGRLCDFYIEVNDNDGIADADRWGANLKGATVPPNTNDWYLNQNNVMPYMEYYKHTVGGVQHAWYQPNYMVEATDHAGVADAGSDADTIIDDTLTEANDYWIGGLVTIISAGAAAPEGETSICTAYALGTTEITVTPAFSAAVEATDTYTVDFGTLIDRSYYGLSFDGVNDYVDCGDDTSLDTVDAITVEAWVKMTTAGRDQEILCRDDGANRNYEFRFAADDSCSLTFWVSNVAKSIGASTTFLVDIWYHIVATYNKEFINIYTNGSIDATPVAETGAIDNDDVSLTLGAREDGANRLLAGIIDEVRIYNRALGQPEIEANYNSGVGSYAPYSTTGLVGWWHIEEGSGTGAILIDSSGEGNTGDITGATWVNGKVPRPAGNAGTNDSRLTWGANPTGVAVALGGMVSTGQPTPGALPADPARDILLETPVTDWYIEPDVGGTLLTNPLRPFVTMWSDNSTLTEIQCWRIYALAIILLVTVATAISVGRHQGITAIMAGVAILGAVVLTIFPMWALVFAIGMFIGGLVMERSPSL